MTHERSSPPFKSRQRITPPLLIMSLMALLALVGLLTVSGANDASAAPAAQAATLTPSPTPTPAYATSGPVSEGLAVRTYGYENLGAGDPTVITRPVDSPGGGTIGTGYVEDKPYTDPEAPFDPQNRQAPRYDSITWNPVIMSEQFTPDENARAGLYSRLFATGSGINIAEKVWHRQWYEPRHLDKDQDPSGTPGTINPDDIFYPAIMQEFTYGLIGNQPLSMEPPPVYARAGGGTMVFPVGQRASELLDANGNLITSGTAGNRGLGLTSLDAEFDGLSDIVHIESEQSLYDHLSGDVALDFNGNRALDPLDAAPGTPLNGDELLVLRLDDKVIDLDPATPQRNVIQFLDHVAVLRNTLTNPPGAVFDIYWTGSFSPRYLGTIQLGRGDAALANVNGAPQIVRAIGNGGSSGGNLCSYPGGPWFIYLAGADAADNRVTVVVGRALGATFAPMEVNGGSNIASTQPWWLKRMYVDGHEYNTVAISTRGGGTPIPGNFNNGCAIAPGSAVNDPSEFTYITLRTPTPKGPDVFNAQHSVILEGYLPGQRLPMLPPFNYEHFHLADVQSVNSFPTVESSVPYFGPLIGPVAPILQDDGPFPYQSYQGPQYNDPAATSFFYVAEDREPQFLGELAERYAQTVTDEFWYTQHFWTLPDQFTSFILPNTPEGNPPTPAGANPDLYLVASGFRAPESMYLRWEQDSTTGASDVGGRVKFWFDPDGQGLGQNKIYKDGTGIRIYGRGNEGVQTRGTNVLPTLGFPIEIPFYTDWLSIFDPRGTEAPVKDSLTLNPAYLAEFRSGTEPLAPYYGLIAADGIDAREKVFPRIWYEPNYLDKTLRVPPTLRLTGPGGAAVQASVAEVEPNNVCSDAAVTTLSQTNGSGRYTGGVVGTDADIYRFTISSDRRVRIFTDPGGAIPVLDPGFNLGEDAYIEIFGACTGGVLSEPIFWDDNSAPGLHASADLQLTSGDYYVRVVAGPQAGAGGVTYGLNILADPNAYEDYRFPALQQEYTYLFLDYNDDPTFTGPGGRFFFPTATDRQSLPLPPSNAGFGWSPASPSTGAGLTTFDTNFDGVPEVVNIETEQSLATLTGIQADFNANGRLDLFDPTIAVPSQLSGDELVVFRTEGQDLGRGATAQFMDYLVRLTNVDYTTGRADLEIWYAGGGLHPTGTTGSCAAYSKHPDFIRTISLNLREMAIVDRNSVRRIAAGGTNIITPNVAGSADGAWFVYVQGVSAPIPGQPASERASVILGRALGAAGAAIDDGNGGHSFAQPQPAQTDGARGGPWYLKRFFVDGHEYNVAAVITEPGTAPAAAGRFKGITIRTPAPKPCDFVNYEDSIALQGYFQGSQFGVDTNVKPVMPPFNVQHTVMEDIVPRTPEQFAVEPNFLCPVATVGRTASRILPNRPPLTIRINREDREPRFFGELKEMQDYDTVLDPTTGAVTGVTRPPVWSTEQFHTLPDQFTDISLPGGEYYLLTSSWETDLGRLSYRGCDTVIDTHAELTGVHPPFASPGVFSSAPIDPIPAPNVAAPQPGSAATGYFQATSDPAFTGVGRIRVQFWYNPLDQGVNGKADGVDAVDQPGPDKGDFYVNIWRASNNGGPALTATPTATVPVVGPTQTPTPTQTLQPGQPTATQTPTPTPTTTLIPNTLTLRIVPQNSTISVGETTTLSVQVENVNNLYGLDYQLIFNGALLSIEDSDGNAGNGVNVQPGAFPAANNGGNRVIGENNVVGPLINYAASLVAPSQAQSGNGTILSFTVRGVQSGTATIGFNSVQMLDNNAVALPNATVVGATITVLPSSNAGGATGKIIAQGRVTHGGAVVDMGGVTQVTDLEGNYALTNQPGTYDVVAKLSKYLPSAYHNVPIALNGLYSVPTMAVRGGDTNEDGKVDLFDLVTVAANFDIHPIVNPNANINDDDVVDIIDLVLVAGSYGHSGVQDGAALTAKLEAKAAKGAPSAARVSLDAPRSVKAGQEFKVAVKLSDVQGLFGANVSVTYDAARVQLVDADDNAAGVQATVGSLMEGGYVARNKGADGVYRLGATRVAPQSAFDGSGTLVTLTFRAVESGAPGIAVSDARLVDEDAAVLPVVISSGK